ncbi:MAG: DUF350 domain-containing protein [Candidatus Rokuibacteriota bacterium]
MAPVLDSLFAGLPVLLTHVGLTLIMLVGGVLVYLAVTPYHEMKLVRAGNVAAALSFAGIILALAIPLAASLKSSVTLFDILAWGSVAVALQLVTFFVVDRMLRGLSKRIEHGELSAAIVLVAAKLAVALVTAAALAI